MAETGVVLARITITRLLTDDGIEDHVLAESEDGDELRLVEALGLMRLAELNLIGSYGACDCADDEGDE